MQSLFGPHPRGFAINFHDGASDWPFKHFNLKSLTDIGYISARR
jgi:hypothetical protein